MYENLNIRQPVGVCGVRKGSWSVEEDELLRKCIQTYGEGNWKRIPKRAGLNRCRKSCRWRWLNYLKPSIKRGDFSDDEIGIIIEQHKLLGNRWSVIAGRLPGRTINDVKNYCNTHIYKKFSSEAISLDNECDIVNDNDCNNQNAITNSPPQTTNTHINNTTTCTNTTHQSPIEKPLVIDALDKVEQHDCANWWEDILLELQRDESEGISIITSGPGPASIFGVEESNVNDRIDKIRTSFNELPNEQYGPYLWEEDLLEFDVNIWE